MKRQEINIKMIIFFIMANILHFLTKTKIFIHMILDIDFIIEFLKKNTFLSKKTEIDEQGGEAPAASTPSPSSGAQSSAPSGKSPKKWESGLTRGKANQVGNTKWESGRTFGKTYMNDPKFQWSSGRTMGKTAGSDFA
jgi:hypothetical protein